MLNVAAGKVSIIAAAVRIIVVAVISGTGVVVVPVINPVVVPIRVPIIGIVIIICSCAVSASPFPGNGTDQQKDYAQYDQRRGACFVGGRACDCYGDDNEKEAGEHQSRS